MYDRIAATTPAQKDDKIVSGAVAPTKAAPAAADEGAARFEELKASLRAEIGDTAFRSWIAPVTYISAMAGTLELAAPTRLVRDWVRGHYSESLKTLWNGLPGQQSPVERIEVVTRRANAPAAAEASNIVSFAKPAGADPAEAVIDMQEDPTGLSSPLDPRMTFDSYIVAEANAFAAGAARKVADGEGTGFNPLVIHSRVGLGKTHLLHAIAHRARESRPGARVVYMSAEKFMYSFVRALRFKDTLSFKQHLRSIDVLMIDDIQFICGKESTQEEFFHTINALIDQGKQVVVTADRAPAELTGLGARLQSRLNGGLVTEIRPLDAASRRQLLAQKCAMMKREAPAEVLDLLAERITASTREMEGALARLIAHAELTGQPVTLDGAERLLQDLLAKAERRVSIDDIQKAVAEHYRLRLADMHSPRRARPLARPRQLAMYLCKVLTVHSLPEIGRGFGGRDHTTIIHGIRKIEELLEGDSQLQNDLCAIKRVLGV